MQRDAAYWIRALDLIAHPEGGYYRETHRAAHQILPQPPFAAARAYMTSILFLLTIGQVSKLHRIKSDEIWCYHLGDPLEIVSIDEAGRQTRHLLGANAERGECFQCAVPPGVWFGARHPPDQSGEQGFTLVGCPVAPGFDFSDFELGDRQKLIEQFPKHRDLIEALT